MDPHKIDHSVELLSLKGCTEVWRVIEQLENGVDVAETRGLDDEERHQVLEELKSVMAVYRARK